MSESIESETQSRPRGAPPRGRRRAALRKGADARNTVETFRTTRDRGETFEVAITGDVGGGRVRVEVLDPGYEGHTFAVARKSLTSRGLRTVAVHAS